MPENIAKCTKLKKVECDSTYPIPLPKDFTTLTSLTSLCGVNTKEKSVRNAMIAMFNLEVVNGNNPFANMTSDDDVAQRIMNIFDSRGNNDARDVIEKMQTTDATKKFWQHVGNLYGGKPLIIMDALAYLFREMSSSNDKHDAISAEMIASTGDCTRPVQDFLLKAYGRSLIEPSGEIKSNISDNEMGGLVYAAFSDLLEKEWNAAQIKGGDVQEDLKGALHSLLTDGGYLHIDDIPYTFTGMRSQAHTVSPQMKSYLIKHACKTDNNGNAIEDSEGRLIADKNKIDNVVKDYVASQVNDSKMKIIGKMNVYFANNDYCDTADYLKFGVKNGDNLDDMIFKSFTSYKKTHDGREPDANELASYMMKKERERERQESYKAFGDALANTGGNSFPELLNRENLEVWQQSNLSNKPFPALYSREDREIQQQIGIKGVVR